jgi:hypothetical protein
VIEGNPEVPGHLGRDRTVQERHAEALGHRRADYRAAGPE